MSNPKELINRLNNLMLKATRKQRKCGYKNCLQPTVKNHTVANSLMSNFIKDGHVRMLAVDAWKPGMLTFSRIGLNDATTFQGLCNTHDSEIFLPIDTPAIDLNDYRNQLLLSYRATFQEKLKKTIKKEVYAQYALENPNSSNHGVLRAAIYTGQFTYNLLNAAWYEEQLLYDIENATQNFVFHNLKLPYFDIAGSELNTYEPDGVTNFKRAVFESCGHFEPFSDIFIHLIPHPGQQYLSVVIGAHRKDIAILSGFYKRLQSLAPLKCLSDILTLYMDGWVCSESFHDQFLKKQVKIFVRIFEETGDISASRWRTSLSLFNQT